MSLGKQSLRCMCSGRICQKVKLRNLKRLLLDIYFNGVTRNGMECMYIEVNVKKGYRFYQVFLLFTEMWVIPTQQTWA